jgi:prolactin regulatory element-binding protein
MLKALYSGHLTRKQKSTYNLFNSTDPNEYQKCTAVAGKPGLLAVSSSNKQTGLLVLRLDNLKEKYSKPDLAVQDIAFSSDGKILGFVTKESLILLESETGKEQVRLPPPKRTDYGFAKLRFTDNSIVALLNDYPSRKGNRAAYLAVYTIEGTLVNLKQIPKLASASAIDSTEDHTVVGGSDLSLTVFSNKNLKTVARLNQVHGFSITSISINRAQTKVASTSVANTVHVFDMPEEGAFYLNTYSLVWALLSVALILVLMIIVLYFGLYQMSSNFFHSRVGHLKRLMESDLGHAIGEVTEAGKSLVRPIETVISERQDL